MIAERTTIALAGVVGSGKSSTAKAIVGRLRAAGQQAEYVRFQDFTNLRRPARNGPVRNAPADAETAAGPHRNVTRWAGYARRRLSWAVAAGYVARVAMFKWRLRRQPAGVVLVFDRYFYDSLVHYELDSAGLRLKLLLWTIPRPDVAALLIVGRETVMARRPTYAPEYIEQVTASYEQLARHVPELLTTRTDDFESVDAVAARILDCVRADSRWRTNAKS